MSWKNLKQQSFAEALLVEHNALTELDDVQKLIDWSRIETMLSGMRAWVIAGTLRVVPTLRSCLRYEY